jgi:hypothetical protein
MRLPDEVQKCVVFLGQKVRNKKTGAKSVEYKGTAFFVGIPLSTPNAAFVCLVTARHNAEKLGNREFCIRANTKDGLSKTYWLGGKNSKLRWWCHPTDDSVDATVLLWGPPEEVDYLYIGKNMFLSPEKIVNKRMGVGDEVFITGLFSKVSGKTKNLPIVRTGNVAMIPPSHEKIPVKWNYISEMEAYLIEARSIGGLSGSPVFIQRSIEVQPAEHTGRRPLGAGAVFWLGLIHGHWDTPPRTKANRVNMGVAIVVPSYKIMEIIRRQEILDRASEAMDQVFAEDHPIVAGSSPSGVWDHMKDEATSVITNAAAIAEPSTNSWGSAVLDPDIDRDEDSNPSN